MERRTTVLLDPESRKAAKQIAAKLDVSASEVIRRALRSYAASTRRVTSKEKRRRTLALKRLISSFAGNDPEREIARLKREDPFS